MPFLKYLSDSKEHSFREAIEHLSNEFKLSKEEKEEILPSGQQPVINNRIGWARTYMLKAGLLEAPKRGYLKISERGLDVLKEKPAQINVKYLEKFPEFIEFRTTRKRLSAQISN